MRYISLLFLVVLTFSSCAVRPSRNIPTAATLGSNEGMIVGTISIEKSRPVYNSYYFHYNRMLEDSYDTYEKKIWIFSSQWLKVKHKPDYVDGNKAVYLYSIKEVQGKYQFSLVRLHENGGSLYQKLYEKTMNFPFEIEKGKVKYLGELYLDVRSPFIELNDKRERDLKYFKEKYPLLKIAE